MSQTLKALLNVFSAIKVRNTDRTKHVKAFKQRQSQLYSEGLIIFKLREQFAEVVRKFDEDPSISSVVITVSEEAFPYTGMVFTNALCDIVPLSDRQFIVTRKDIYV